MKLTPPLAGKIALGFFLLFLQFNIEAFNLKAMTSPIALKAGLEYQVHQYRSVTNSHHPYLTGIMSISITTLG